MIDKQGDIQIHMANQAATMSPEQLEEQKLMEKYKGMPLKGQSNFLQKKLQAKKKFFDSGDYNSAKAKGLNVKATGGGIPRPHPPSAPVKEKAPEKIVEEVAAPVSPEKIEPKSPVEEESPPLKPTLPLVSPSVHVVSDDDEDDTTGVEIPRPDTVPQRKASIIYPADTKSKLSPQPLLHHVSGDSLLPEEQVL